MLYPFSEKPLLIPVSRTTSFEVGSGGRRHGRNLCPKGGWVQKGHLRMEAVNTSFHLS